MDENRPLITVAICTHNRAEMLRYALDGLARSMHASCEWNVLVVDNASSDNTAEYAAARAADWPDGRLSVCSETIPGLSYARNKALNSTRSEVVAFIDDDSVVSPEWLGHIAREFATHPRAAIVGGPIRVTWLDHEPEWIHPDLLGYFSGVDYGPLDKSLTYPDYPYGANFAVRRKIAQQLGGFRTDLGYRGKVLISGEETDLAIRAEMAGYDIRYSSNAVVDHLIQSDRNSESWLLRRAYSGGLAETILKKSRYPTATQIRLMAEDVRWYRYSWKNRDSSGGEPERVRCLVRYWSARGRCIGWLTRSGKKKLSQID